MQQQVDPDSRVRVHRPECLLQMLPLPGGCQTQSQSFPLKIVCSGPAVTGKPNCLLNRPEPEEVIVQP
jgi:hypothetical protein